MGILSDLVPGEITDLLGAAIPQATAPDVSFKPFTVRGPTGEVQTNAAGGTTYYLSGAGQTLQDTLEAQALSRLTQDPFGLAQQQTAAGTAFGLGQQFMGQAGMPMAGREQEVYDRIRATQLGEEERQRLALEERLASQGRLGVRTSMFGGTPEQLALSQAQEEAQNRAVLMAMQQAQQEQQQQAALGAQFAGLGSGLSAQQQALRAAEQQAGLSALQGAYIPQAAMLSALSPALNVAGLADVARRQGGELGLEAQMANIAGEVGQRTALANMYGGIYGGLLSAGSSLLGNIFDFFGGD
jgi:hypothetical protein